MANNTLTLYRDIKITEDRNMIIDKINQYLSANEPGQQFTDWSYSDIQYIKDLNELLEFKIRVKVTMKDETYDFHYAKIFNGNDTKYYFVTAFKFIADNTCELSLKLDTLNTLYRKMISVDPPSALSVSKRTHITRCHKKRFSFLPSNHVAMHIDEYSEGVNPKLYKKVKSTIYQQINNEDFTLDVYLAYIKITDHIEIWMLFNGEVRIFSGEPSTPSAVASELLSPYWTLNKNDSRIIKIIKIPYIPISQQIRVARDVNNNLAWIIPLSAHWTLVSDGGYTRLRYWVSGQNAMDELINDKLIDPQNNSSDAINPLLFTDYNNTLYPKTLNDARVIIDPKLKHSDFFYWKYIYDSFAKVVKLESELNNMPATDYPFTYYELGITFYMTTTINSKFMFKFDDLQEYGFTDEDYNLFLIIQRNNEMCIYNDEYINYIRSGYNYDIKNKTRQEVFSWITAGAGAVTAVAGAVTGHPLAIVGGAMAIGNAINQTIANEINMEKRLDQLKWQGASVFGADDVDLMSYYSNNKLSRIKYEVSDRMKNLLNDLFYYTGYIEDKFSKEIFPNTRIWFDYIKADVVFESMKVAIPAKQLEEFKKKYAEGVTIFHMQTINSVKTWNLEQNKENWEIEFFQ